MSGICGVFRRDGRPIAPETIPAMVSAMRWLGPDGCSHWWDGPVGLGHLMLRNTPESLHETQPLISSDRRRVLVSTTRLDNRAELLSAFRVPRDEWSTRSDAWLCLRAYETWAEECPDHLIGDWAFALWDAPRRTLFVARDHHGVPGLFYHVNDRVVAFASSIKGLLALDEVPRRLDEEYLAGSLVHSPPAERTPYDGIQILHGSNQLLVKPGDVIKRRYYHLEHAPEVRLGSDAEYVEAFQELFTESVRCRLRGLRPAAVSLSGGLDSGAVAVEAASLLGDDRLSAFTAVPAHPTEGLLPPGRYGDERPYVEAIRAKAHNIDVTYVRDHGAGPLAAIRKTIETCDMPWSNPNMPWIQAIIELAGSRGIGAVLNGFGGNATISWYGHGSVLESADWRHPTRVIRRLQTWRARHGLSFYHAVKNQLIRPLFPRPVLQRYANWRNGDAVTLDDSPIQPELARAYDLEARLRMERRRPSWMFNPDSRAGRCEVLRAGGYSAFLYPLLDSSFGLETREPALDKRIMEFCLGIPDDQFGRDGETRLLIRRAMADRLPPLVLENTSRELQSADIGYRLRETAAELRQSLESSEASPVCHHYLDLPRIRRVLERLESSDRLDRALNEGSVGVLLHGLVMGEFLRREA